MSILRKYGWLAAAWIALVLPAITPFLQPDFTFSEDGPLHLWRVSELDRALGQGIIYPRWAPDLYFGYGSPVFIFYPPLSYYFAELVHLLGLDIESAVKATFSVCLIAGVVGAFLLGRSLFASQDNRSRLSELAGLVTAAAYVYAPYFLIDIHIRGAVAEALAMAVLPFCFWSLRRLMLAPTLSKVLLTGLFFAILLLSHNMTAVFSAPVLAGFVLLHLLLRHTPRERLTAAVAVAGAGAIALLLTAFYLLPNSLELAFVRMGQPALRSRELLRLVLDQMQPASRVIQPQWTYDYPEDAFPLGLASVTLAVAGLLLGWFLLRRRAKIEFGFWVGVTLIAGVGLTDWSRGVWLALPPLQLLQFPWRLTIFVTLGLALTTGLLIVIAARIGTRVTGVFALALVANCVWVGVAELHIQPWYVPLPSIASPAVLARYETNTRGAGMSLLNEFLPVTVKRIPFPDATSPITASDQGDQAAIPDVRLVSVSPNEWRMTVDTPLPASVPVRAFYYPDWSATIDGRASSLRASASAGLLTVDIPAGQHAIHLVQGSLPARDFGMMLTGLGIVFAMLGLVLARRRGENEWPLPAAALFALILVFGLPQTRALSAAPAPAITSTHVDVNESLRLIGFSLDPPSDSFLQLHLFWHVKRAVGRELPIRIQLKNPRGEVWAQRSQLSRFGTGGMRYWVAGEIVEDLYQLPIPGDLPNRSLTLAVASGDDPFVPVGAVNPSQVPSRTGSLPIEHRVDAKIADSITLAGFSARKLSPARPSDTLDVTLYWRAERDILEDFTVLFQLLDQDGLVVAQRDSMPNNGFSPTMLWQPGYLVADRRPLKLPAVLSPGLYRLVAGLYRFKTLERLPVSTGEGALADDLITLTTIKVPPTEPFAPAHPLQADFGSAIRLSGFTLKASDKGIGTLTVASTGSPARWTAPARGRLELTLGWTAQRAPDADYTVSVQLIDANGQMVRQQDNPPVKGHYPTRLWEPGEHITDPYALSLVGLPAGQYTLLTGLYSPTSGLRLTALDSKGEPLPDNVARIGEIQLTWP